MPHFRRYVIVSLIILTACALAIWPPEKNLRLGKDLAGGVSLVYPVEIKDTDPADIVGKTIEVLKDRVNPDGLYEMTFVQQGKDRIEISMPLPNDAVKHLRAEYEKQLKRLDDFKVDSAALERALRLSGQARLDALNAMADTPQRKALFGPLLEALAKVDETAAARAKGVADKLPDAELDKLTNAAGEALEKLEAVKGEVLSATIPPDDVRAALELSSVSTTVRKAEKSSEVVTIDSPRDRAVGAIRARIAKVPDGDKLLEEIIAARNAYKAQVKGYDDPADLERLLQGAGVLEFRIAIAPGTWPDEARLRRELRERGPDGVESKDTVWRPINKLEGWFDTYDKFESLRNNPSAYFAASYGLVVEERDGKYYVLLRDEAGWRITKAEGAWKLAQAFQSTDELGRPAVGFRMDEKGAVLMGDLTESHRGQQMAIVLDDEVYSAPRINSRISNSGIIQGSFSAEELTYLIKTLGAGSLQAKLASKPISKDFQAPDLGKDNLDSGLKACWYSFIVVGIFMVLYYFIPGGVAVVGMIAVAIMLLGAMALQRAAFSLPGIAGVALTFGMAVDANVLIYERLREELLKGFDIKTAVRLSYQRAFATIVDCNITHLITCVVLGYMGTSEIKGFAITLGIGVIATMVMALVITHVILVWLVEYVRLPGVDKSLPMTLPWLRKAMMLHVDWLRLRYAFGGFSLLAVVLSFVALGWRGERLFGLEFRGGTAITFTLKEGKTSTRADIKHKLETIAEAPNAAPALKPLLEAEVVPINPQTDGVTSDRFAIRTSIADVDLLNHAVVDGFADIVEARQALQFKNSDKPTIPEGAPVYQLIENELGPNIGRGELKNNVAEFVGGAAVVMQDLTPAPSKGELEQRLNLVRNQPDFSAKALKRTYQIVVIDGDDKAVKTAAILVRDPGVSIYDEARWREQLGQVEWNMMRLAYTKPTIVASVQNFSGVIAETFRSQAIVAVLAAFLLIMIYVWMRFGSFRYSLAAIVPVFHDAGVAVGFIAVSGWLTDRFPSVTQALNIHPFKIDLGMIAGILTIIGYSINDTIIVLDRIRENRGKLWYATRQCINDSINQTMTRTFITSGTTTISLCVIVAVGGEATASFAWTMLIGVFAGTYSSFAIAAPFVWVRHPPAAAPYPGKGAPAGGPGNGSGLATT